MAPALIITTSAFPFGGLTEQSFILPELEPLAQQFGRVVIVPQQLETEALAEASGDPQALQRYRALHDRRRRLSATRPPE